MHRLFLSLALLALATNAHATDYISHTQPGVPYWKIYVTGGSGPFVVTQDATHDLSVAANSFFYMPKSVGTLASIEDVGLGIVSYDHDLSGYASLSTVTDIQVYLGTAGGNGIMTVAHILYAGSEYYSSFYPIYVAWEEAGN